MAKEDLDKALANVNSGRRGFLRGLLLGGAALAALPLVTSTAVAQDQGTEDTGKKKKKKKGTDQTT
jgi:hypothetical protein